MRASLLALLPGLMAAACSGRYEVGVEPTAGAGGSSVGAAAAPSGVGGAAEASPGAGGTAGPPTSLAAGSGQGGSAGCAFYRPQALQPPFAPPATVWARISVFLFDQQVPPFTELPAETTYAWAGTVALEALAQAQVADGAAPGTRRFLQSWLGLPEAVPFAFERDWAALLAKNSSALGLLLLTPLAEPERIGIFNEVDWLKALPRIVPRGVALSTAVLGVAVPSPPAGIPQTLPGTDRNFTRREQLEKHQSDPTCAGCHRIMDPLGISLEYFDELGQYRRFDGRLPVDSSGVVDLDGQALDFTSMRDLAPHLVRSCQTIGAFASAAYDDARVANVGRAGQMRDYPSEQEDRDRVTQAFGSGDRSYRSLVQAIAQTEAFLR